MNRSGINTRTYNDRKLVKWLACLLLCSSISSLSRIAEAQVKVPDMVSKTTARIGVFSVKDTLFFNDPTTGDIRFRLQLPAGYQPSYAAWNPTGTLLVISGKTTSTTVYQITADAAVSIKELPVRSQAATFNHQGDRLYLFHSKSILKSHLSVFNTQSWENIKTAPAPFNLKNLSVLPGDALLTYTSGGLIKTVHTADLKAHKVYWETAQQDIMTSHPATPDQLASATPKGVIQIRKMPQDAIVTEINGHITRIKALEYNPAGSLLASADKYGKLFVWSLATKRPLLFKENIMVPPHWDTTGTLFVQDTARPYIRHILFRPEDSTNTPVNIPKGKGWFGAEKMSRFNAIPQPVIDYSPETGIMLGLSASLLVRPIDTANAGATYRPSIYTVSGAYGFGGQQIRLGLYMDTYTKAGWHFEENISYNAHNRNYYFGIGGASSREDKKVYRSNTFNLNGGIYKLLHNVYNVGINYHLRHDTKSSFEDKSTPNLPEGIGGTLLGIGPVLRYDNRDNILYSTKGSYLDISFFRYGIFGIGDFNFNKIKVDYRKYFPLSKADHPVVIAVQGLADMTWDGQVPFYNLPYFTSDRTLRGLWRNLYVDNQIITVQAELRGFFSQADPRIGYSVFAGAGDGSRNFFRIYSPDIKFGYGAGLRIQIVPKIKMYARVDYCFTSQGDQGFFGGIGTAF
ncbi:BamA/TamA family outer membrane protein [Chitinophaga pendula]|uniref:BamA/TamA family outer membrane protein n=1 Tax=Chitinophaga pendula TaxID=2849666 RepID=UPI001CECFC23|nr:BamA/TamA family outer membrane protein [Chitinophaga pendula]UCJ09744.1 BamA/TamA family outer membrane protein [Chitinophaga pendula]